MNGVLTVALGICMWIIGYVVLPEMGANNTGTTALFAFVGGVLIGLGIVKVLNDE